MKGWLIWAYDVTGDQYLRAATVLAHSIKATQKHNGLVAVVINQQMQLSQEQKNLFDHVIAVHTDYPKEIMSLGYELSPFQETISVEADCIVCTDLSHWWNELGQHDILFPGQVKDIRGQRIVNSFYRKGFAKHGLADVWSGVFYWQKSRAASDVFKSSKALCEQWRDNMPFEWTENAANDEFFAAVMAHENYQHCIDSTGFLTFTHNRTHDQAQYLNNRDITASDLNIASDGSVWIGPWRQTGILHYHQKHWVTAKVEEQIGAWYE
jgi:hypothetical protein